MNHTNPYKANESGSDRGSIPDCDSLSNKSALKISNLALIGLRLLGLMFTVDGVSGLISNSVAVFTEYKQMIEVGYEPMVNAVTFGLVFSSFFYTIVGVYLLTNGKAILRLVLMTDTSYVHEGSEENS